MSARLINGEKIMKRTISIPSALFTGRFANEVFCVADVFFDVEALAEEPVLSLKS